jgi:nucleotide-binding universal stress UspA family protein
MDGSEFSAGSERVIVGVDGSERDLDAVHMAAREASLRGWSLDIVHVEDRPPPSPDVAAWTPALATKELLARANTWASHTNADVPVETSVSAGRPDLVLEALSRSAGLIVVGTGRKVGIARFLSGTVSLNVAAHAWCPVLVVGEPVTAPRGRVVVGVDGSRESVQAVHVAAGAAVVRGAELIVHTAYQDSADDALAESDSWRSHPVEERHRAVQDQVLAEALTSTREPPRLTQQLVNGEATETLLEASTNADLLVVGNRGRGGLLSTLLGSVTMVLLQRSHCPVLVARAP